MIQNTKNFYGNKLGAADGDIGHVKDFYFDDNTWVVRYLVADTGSWLSGREVLLSPHAFGKWDAGAKLLHVNLTRQQIEKSPSPETHKPVSRQYEMEFYRYYGWPAYWEGTDIWGLGGFPVMIPPVGGPVGNPPRHRHREDKHLQSMKAVTGFYIEASDGTVGHVTGFLVDDQQWTIRDVVVETGHWYAGKEVLIPTGRVDRISYDDSKIFVSLTQGDIRRTAEDKIVHPHAKPPKT